MFVHDQYFLCSITFKDIYSGVSVFVICKQNFFMWVKNKFTSTAIKHAVRQSQSTSNQFEHPTLKMTDLQFHWSNDLQLLDIYFQTLLALKNNSKHIKLFFLLLQYVFISNDVKQALI